MIEWVESKTVFTTMALPEHTVTEQELERIRSRIKSVSSSRTFNRILDTLDLRTKKTLDLGCGYGEYLIAFGKGSIGITTTRAEVEYGESAGVAIREGNVETVDFSNMKETFEAVWANNLFEHLLSPHSFLMRLKQTAQNDTMLVLGVPVLPRITSLMKLSKFRGALASPHINFFTKDSLALTVERTGWKVKHARPFIFSNYYLDMLASIIAPHIYVVATNDAAFVYPIKKYNEWKDDSYYGELLKLGGR